MEYYPVHSLDEMIVKFESESTKKSNNEFVEVLVYSRDTAVIMTGNLTDDAEEDKVSACVLNYF